MNLTDYISAAPEMILLVLICVVLIADLFIDNEHRVATFWLSMAALAITGWSILATAPIERVVVFDGSYVSDPLSQILKITAVAFVALAFLYARDYLRANDLHKGEYYLLGLFGLLGMMIMTSANSLLTMYLGLETLALSLYALVAIDRNSATAAESAMKYFVLGAIASGALLYGISWIYGVTGTLKFDEIAAVIAAEPDLNNLPLWFGLAFLIVGIAFKFGAVPFHMWLPDVYQGARTPVTLYIASAPKLAALAFTVRILVDGLGGLQDVWADMIMVVAVLSLLVGNVIAIAQTNIKRMLGYSAIAHVGFILLAIFCGTDKGYAAALFYTLTYIVATAGAFGIVILLSRRGYEAESLADFKGLNERSPWFTLMMMFLMLSLTGIPPFIGFFGKLNVIDAVLSSGYPGLAVLMVVASVVGAFYYLRVIWYMYFEPAEDQAVLQASADTRLVLSLNGVAVLGLGIVPGWLWALCTQIALSIR
ncbi:MAG: NADH-quinone oxidoreductase subunit NuoN [Gammaproteobacteria bacterium]|nr:NADH-quinone oxidoreductase subunit NuoN [Gammaproteobacteria bacterium]MDH3373134.1 NADH-quinone oxidoreductase subunit NuoN [Gammaproteobacteria bacterium]MDH3408228.1 NADH-quinone oxidoreductase subunit NuoN [Gammaproteobacteria bacterium]MDH3552597.1 NADH-quinone oxidoreductase subunit NuoN [Gammaproteobacteria bacterium]